MTMGTVAFGTSQLAGEPLGYVLSNKRFCLVTIPPSHAYHFYAHHFHSETKLLALTENDTWICSTTTVLQRSLPSPQRFSGSRLHYAILDDAFESSCEKLPLPLFCAPILPTTVAAMILERHQV
ncbi:hypothetical protein ACGC1H_006862 [Rhizoctonia solani]